MGPGAGAEAFVHRVASAVRPAQTLRRAPPVREASAHAAHQVLRRPAHRLLPAAARAGSAAAVARRSARCGPSASPSRSDRPRVLDDLPRQAKRLARWQARLDARLAREGGQATDLSPGGRAIAYDVTPTPNPSPQGGGGPCCACGRCKSSTILHCEARGSSPSPLWGGVRGGGLSSQECDCSPPCGGAETSRSEQPIRQDKGGHFRAQGASAARFRRLSPMRPGRPPGWHRRPTHPVYDVLNELHGLAVWAREPANTS